LNFDNLRRNYAFKNGQLEVLLEKIIREGTENKIKPDFILRPFSDLATILPV
jgi:hypothetical protein